MNANEAMGQWLARGAAALAFALTAASAAQAVSIAPVLVNLSPAKRIVSITIANNGKQAVSFQTQALAWSQVDGVDQYGATTDLIVVPPIAAIAAGSSQIFRVTTHLPPSTQEVAFRVVFEDVTEMAAAPAEGESMQVNLRINHSLPVFFAASEPIKTQAQVVACATARAGCVRIENTGNRYVVVRTLSLSRGDWKHELTVSTRVLAGAWREWEFTLPAAADTRMQVSADTSAGTLVGVLPIN